jgi:hypothetical protein
MKASNLGSLVVTAAMLLLLLMTSTNINEATVYRVADDFNQSC